MIKINPEILECPFCSDDETKIAPMHGRYYYVMCSCCEASGPKLQSKKAAINSWNLISKLVKSGIDSIGKKG